LKYKEALYMKDLNLVEDIGKSIIKKLHYHAAKVALDDPEYIPVIKKILDGIVDELSNRNFSKTEAGSLKKSLKQYARDLYIKAYIKNKLENETVEEAGEMGKEYFEYVYRYGRHPE
jgi:hypothetical protein